MKIAVSVVIDKPLETVWNAYVSPEDIVHWNFASDDWHTTSSQVNLSVGGHFSSWMEAKDGSVGFDFAGTYTNIVSHELIEYEFGERRASVAFKQNSDGVLVTVEFDSEDINSVEQQRDGWQAILNNFAKHVSGK